MSTRKSARLSTQVAAKAIPTEQLAPIQNHVNHPKRTSTKRKPPQPGSEIQPTPKPENANPKTPPRKRIKRTATVTPAQVTLMTAPYSTGDIDDATPPPAPTPRPADPHMTNAPLKTPSGSRLVTYPAHPSPSKAGLPLPLLPSPTTTTSDLLADACAHLLRVDPRLAAVIAQNPCHIFSPAGLAEEIDPFRSLASGIIAQQVSGAAAKAIKNKFVALFNAPGDDNEPVRFPTPARVAACDEAFLRTAGLSQRKTEYIKGLAEKFASGELSARMLIEAPYEEVVAKLTAVRGLGLWSVEMFACFGLKRLDVFSTGDLAVQRGMAALEGRDVSKFKAKGGGKFKYMPEKEMLEIAARFAPYRSLFMWYMWRIENVNIEAVQGD